MTAVFAQNVLYAGSSIETIALWPPSDRYKYKIENWQDLKSAVLEDILVPLGVDPALWSKFINGKAKIVES